MGAIAGLFHPATPKPVDPARVRAMAAAMAHRGPDGAGEWTAPGVGFAHRRLAVIGGAEAVQPVATPDLRYALMLDGTILNHAALREELGALGHVVTGPGDAEVLLHGFAAWGPSLLDRLEGAFAFAVHDAATQTLFLARDRLGAKPLFHATLADGALAFASELKGLLAHPLLRGVPDLTAIDDYLAFGYVPDDNCVMAGVRKLPAAHFLLVERSRPPRPPRRWWRPRAAEVFGTEALLPAARRVVGEATAGGGAPAAVLDGGVADAAVVALLAEASAKAVRTVAVADAASVTHRFATAHRTTDMPDVGDMLALLAAAFDEPCAAPEALAALTLAGAAREQGTVVLSGLGAVNDEAAWRGFARRQRWREVGRLPGAIRAMLGTAEVDQARAAGMIPNDARRALFASEIRRELAGHRPEARYAAAMRDSGCDDPLDRALHATLTLRLPARELAVVDRAGMAAGVEWRAPFADHRFVAVAAGLPRGVRAGRTPPLATAMAQHLPPLPAVAPALPVAAWLRGPLAAVAGLARSPLLEELGWFDRERLAHLADQHRAGQADHAVALWRMLVLECCLSRLFGWPASA